MSHLIYTKPGSDIRLCHVADELKTRGIEASAKIRDGVVQTRGANIVGIQMHRVLYTEWEGGRQNC